MATYFHGGTSEMQSSADGLQTLYLMNPNYLPYSADTAQHPTPNMLLVNPPTAGNALNLASLTHAPPQSPNQHLIGVTIPTNFVGSNNPDDPTRPSLLGQHEISGFHGFAATAAPRVHYNLWGSIIDQTPSAAAAGSSSGVGATVTDTGDLSPKMGFRRPSQQGLSLSLSSQQTAYRPLSGELEVGGHGQVPAISPSSRGGGGSDDIRIMGNSPSSVSNGVSSMQSVILGSKYLKAAQELLDEVVNVGKGIISKNESTEEANKEKMKADRESPTGNGDGPSGGGGGGGGGENSGKQGSELSTAQRQELQMKKSKLVTMLDEVEQRYRQYRHQMQIVISSFEQAAGYGAAKSYTALALKTISKQFRCLKDAISWQIRATSKSLGEDDYCLGAKVEGSRLRYVDHHIRQQRALQQLGMMQHNAWRPQRGLPERAVSILRAWLFEHFLHPYPKDSDKLMLAKQTGLTRSQVSNWFINARVRLWKPMVEEMYMEEVKEQEQNNGSQDKSKESSNKELASITNAHSQETVAAAIRFDQIKSLHSKPEKSFNNQNTSPTEISNSSMSQSPMGGTFQPQSSFNLARSSEIHPSPNKPRNSEIPNSSSNILSMDMEMKPMETNREASRTNFGISERHRKDGYNPLITGNANHHGSGYGAFSMEDIGRFNVSEQLDLAPRFHGNGVSLTLGLPPSENNNNNLPLSVGTSQHGFLSPNMHLGSNASADFCTINTSPSSHSGASYENMDNIQNRKRFASHLVPDFVA